MKSFFTTLLLSLVFVSNAVYAQPSVDKMVFFSDTSMVNATLKLNFGRLLRQKDKEGAIFPATFSCRLNDSMQVNDQMSVEVRGHFRRSYCYMPPLKLTFNTYADAAMYHLKSLKLVSACKPATQFDQYLLKEFIIYKMYNLITDKSFRVRLLDLNYQDSSGRQKTITEHAFLLEDAKDLAKRNDCTEWTKSKLQTESTDRRQMTIVAIFEYMIGNTDWAVPVNHNIKLIKSKTDSIARPYVVPYDFDYSGFVGTDYAVPDERLGIETVEQRLYRGFPRTMAELNEALDIFKKQKDNIYALVNNFNLLTTGSKRDITYYLDDFFKTIDNPRDVKDTFITNARTQ